MCENVIFVSVALESYFSLMPVIAQHCMVICMIVTMFQLLKKLPIKESELNNVNGKITNSPSTRNTLFRFPTQNEISEFI
jgi:hypothetical protein